MMAAAARPRESLPPLHWAILLALVGAKVVVHIPGLFRYGFFRDELYFLDHWLWGPPEFEGDILREPGRRGGWTDYGHSLVTGSHRARRARVTSSRARG
jgi:hypothetical protein